MSGSHLLQQRCRVLWIFGALGGVSLVLAAAQALAASSTCPLAATAPVASEQQTPTPRQDSSCLISPRAVGTNHRIYDLRSRSEYLGFHIPNAEHSNTAELSRILRGTDQSVVVYDSGKFRSDAFLLCERLRNSGFRNFKVIDGGIAAWAQVNRHPKRLDVSRLSDAEVSAALSDSRTSAVALTGAYRAVLAEHRIRQGTSGRRILVTDTTVPVAQISSFLDGKGATAFYWTGDRERLVALIHAHLAQNQKRIAGPAQSAVCDSL